MKPGGQRSVTKSPHTPHTPGSPSTRSQKARGKRSVRSLHKDFDGMAVGRRQSPQKRAYQHAESSPAKKPKVSPTVNSSQESVRSVTAKSFYKTGKQPYMSPLERASRKKKVIDDNCSPGSSYASQYFDSQKLRNKKENKKNVSNSPYLNFSKNIKRSSTNINASRASLSSMKYVSSADPLSKNISMKAAHVLSEINSASTKSPIKNVKDNAEPATSPRRSPRKKFFKSRSCASAGKLSSSISLQKGKLTFQGRKPDAIAKKEARLANQKTKKPLTFVTTDKVAKKSATQERALLTKNINNEGKENLKPTYRKQMSPMSRQGTSSSSIDPASVLDLSLAVTSAKVDPHSQELFSSQETLTSNSPARSDISERYACDTDGINLTKSPCESKKVSTNSQVNLVMKGKSSCHGDDNTIGDKFTGEPSVSHFNGSSDNSPRLISSAEDVPVAASQPQSIVSEANTCGGMEGVFGDVSNASSNSVLLLSDVSRGSEASASSEEAAHVSSNKRFFPIFTPPGTPSSTSSLSQKLSSNPSTPVHNKSALAGALKITGAAKRSPKLLKKMVDKEGREQMILDFGQKLVGVVLCDSCGMNYTPGEPTDEATHSKFHHRIIVALKFPGWKKENVLQEYPDGSRIIVVLPGEKQAMKKVNLVRAIVDEDLGFVVSSQSVLDRCKTFLFISDDKRVVGCCIAEAISQAYRVIADSGTQSDTEKKDGQRPWCCSTEPEKAKIGINRIWVLNCERRKKIASKLLDCVRFNFLLGFPLAREALAFTDPTPNGRQFATRYTGTLSFLVYKH